MKNVTVINPGEAGYTTEVQGEPRLEELQRAVGGYIEVVPGFTRFEGKRCITYANEDGQVAPVLPFNEVATRLWREQFKTNQNIHGAVVIVENIK